MTISRDQQATLQLLLERGQSYDDLASLLGVGRDQVRDRARAALTELGGADPDRKIGLTDYLLGEADPIDRADASRHLREDPADRELAARLSGRLQELYPHAELPRLPGEPRRERPPRAGAGPPPARQRLAFVLGGAALALLVAVLAIAGAFGGDGGEDADGSDPPTAAQDGAVAAEPVPIRLEPEGGSDAGGVIVFGLAGTDDPFIELQVRNLEPATPEDAYVLWFLSPDGTGFPLPTPLEVDPNGTLSDRIAVPPQIIAFAYQAKTIAIALNNRRRLDREIRRTVATDQDAIGFPGGTVLSAPITGSR